MVIDYLNLVRTGFPPKADPPLIVNADVMLAGPATFQPLEPITRRHHHISQSSCCMQL
jgi:hypothetical protein